MVDKLKFTKQEVIIMLYGYTMGLFCIFYLVGEFFGRL